MSMQLRILTLNIWGIHFLAKSIRQRINALIEHLNSSEGNYDIIALQEVWSKRDYLYIRDHIRTIYPDSYYFLSGLIGSGCCIFSKHPIVAVYEHQYTLNGFPHKIHHGDYFAGKLIGLCKIIINGLRVNVYTTHLHANYHQTIPDDIYLGHRICQAYELIQFIESTSNAEIIDLTILLGDLNLTPDDLGFKLIQGILKLKDTFHDRLYHDIYDPTVGNKGLTCIPFNDSILIPDQGERIDYILYRARNDNIRCLEAYPTLYKIPDNSRRLSYSDHLAVYALLEITESTIEVPITPLENIGQLDDDAQNNLRAACIIVEETIQRLRRERILFACGVLLLTLLLFLFNRNSSINNYLYTLFVIFKNFLCITGIVIGLWFICFGKPVERNALSAILNAMRIRLRPPHFSY